MAKILGLDLGTNSIGLALRNTEGGPNLQQQLVYFTSDIFKSGVGKGKAGEFSYAAERRKKRSPRRLFRSRKQRIWATLALLIEKGCCPLAIEDLNKWRKYDKSKNFKREYPVDAVEFEKWVRLDFDGDGKSDYTSPYQLRAELMERHFDFDNEQDRYKLGRALYHIAQRRGFRSSKGETVASQEEVSDDSDISVSMKKSEEKVSSKLVELMSDLNLPTVGCAFAALEAKGVRVRNSEYQAVRSQYKEEIINIFEYQKLPKDDFYERLVSEKKSEGTIFYKKPLKSQKGAVGKCTLENDKPRCPISHPEFEKFRAWTFINNIQFRLAVNKPWMNLSIEEKEKLYNDVFLRVKTNFDFTDIRVWIEENVINDGVHPTVVLSYDKDKSAATINFKDSTNVSGCPISARLKRLLGENWENYQLDSKEERINKKTGEVHKKSYSMIDIWHVCTSFDELEYIEQFAVQKLFFDTKKVKAMVALWGAIPQGYSMLSLKAIKNINRFLLKGMIYSDAVLVAKLPDILGDEWEKAEGEILSKIPSLVCGNNLRRACYKIANKLIANYKSLDEESKFAVHDNLYVLKEDDLRDVEKAIVDHYGDSTWNAKMEEERSVIRKNVQDLYQDFFASITRDYYKVPRISDEMRIYIKDKYPSISDKNLKKLYHPSMIDIYPAAKEYNVDGVKMKLLGSPVVGALKNPMALRVLHVMRRHINTMLKDKIIDEDTRIVVETARNMCDANMRAAIATYQSERERENKEIWKILEDYVSRENINKEISDLDVDRARLIIEQRDIINDLVGKENYMEDPSYDKLNAKSKKVIEVYKKDVTKYKLWLEQGGKCIYTGQTINIKSLFDDNCIDIEHTIPRSISFDNSLSNLTLCNSHYNRTIKKNRMPSELDEYSVILQRIQHWVDRVDALKDAVAYWKKMAKAATTKESKDQRIRQRHLYEMELEYWSKKVNTFYLKDKTEGFRNSQLVDTRMITKYAYHYLKSVFNSVEVQKGSVTALFRKILGVQSVDEKKCRDKHSHHAIDATMLTLIPKSTDRDNMISLFYQREELKKMGCSTGEVDSNLAKKIKGCKVGNVSGIAEFIEKNILINHISKDQTLTPTRKRVRSRGKIVPLLDERGNKMYEKNTDGSFKLDVNGHKIPLSKRWIKGDCIRGQLHQETFYGAITQAKMNGESFLRDKNGIIITEEVPSFVVRRELKYKKMSKIQDSRVGRN